MREDTGTAGLSLLLLLLLLDTTTIAVKRVERIRHAIAEQWW